MSSELLDETTGILYPSVVELWPLLDLEESSSFYCGSIIINSVKAIKTVEFKLRVATKVRCKGMLRTTDGQGLLKPRNHHRIGIQVKEEAIDVSSLLLTLDNRKIKLKMVKLAEGDRLYKPEEVKKSRWQMIDDNILKNLPQGVQNYIKDGQLYNLRKSVFDVVYPFVIEMLTTLGRRVPSHVDYHDGPFEQWIEQVDPMDIIMEYILVHLETKAF